MVDKVYVIYQDGKRLEKDQSGRSLKIAYLKKGSAKGVVTTLADHYVRYVLGISGYYDKEKYDEEIAKEKLRYSVVEYIPNNEVTK